MLGSLQAFIFPVSFEAGPCATNQSLPPPGDPNMSGARASLHGPHSRKHPGPKSIQCTPRE
eukprot:8451777-Pyramimonas_sp.AAC.1